MIRRFDDKRPVLGKSVYVDESAVVIGDVSLGDDVSVWSTAVIRGDVESIPHWGGHKCSGRFRIARFPRQ